MADDAGSEEAFKAELARRSEESDRGEKIEAAENVFELREKYSDQP